MSKPNYFVAHPCLDEQGRGSVPLTSPHIPWIAPELSELDLTRLRYVPPPSELLLHTLHGIMQLQGETINAIPPQRRGLIVLGHHAFDGLRAEFSQPLRDVPMGQVSPLLFPHTSDMSAGAMAAILFDLRGPVLSISSTDAGFPVFSEIKALLSADVCDAVLLVAVQYVPMPLKESAVLNLFDQTKIPVVDCGVSWLFTGETPPPVTATSTTRVRQKAGHTGACEALLRCVMRIE
ncbi:MAG: hypothetical protein EOL87_15785 [Spartobacteria bacterium]|nr:hypothetical protein [Spartobacteria bacterium]